MKLADVSIRKPVFTVMMVLALVVLGYSSFIQMNIDLFPEIDFPFVIVQTMYPGAGAPVRSKNSGSGPANFPGIGTGTNKAPAGDWKEGAGP